MSTPSLLNIPYLYKAGTLYSQIPESGAGDFTISRTTTVANRSTRINKDGFIETVLDNVPRLDYPLGGAVNGCPALLVEPSAQNQMIQSQDLSLAFPSQANTTPSANVSISPDGTQNADRLTFVTTGGYRLRNFSIVSGTSYTATLFYKNVDFTTGNIFSFQVSDGVVAAMRVNINPVTNTITQVVGPFTNVSSSIENYGNGWYRVRLSGTASNTGGGWYELVTNATKSIDLWGFQFETGLVATSYIPTTTGSVTRNTETIANTSATALIGQTEGTLYWDIAAVAGVLSGTGNPMFGVRNSGTTNWVSLTSNSPSSPFRITAQATTGNLINYTVNITSGKAALAWSSAGLALYVNGSLVATSATNPNFSFSVAELVGYAPFKANAFAIYPNRIPNTAAPGVLSLATLTTP